MVRFKNVLHPLIQHSVYFMSAWTLHWFPRLREMLVLQISRILSFALGLCELADLNSVARVISLLDRRLQALPYRPKLELSRVELIQVLSPVSQISIIIPSARDRQYEEQQQPLALDLLHIQSVQLPIE